MQSIILLINIDILWYTSVKLCDIERFYALYILLNY